MISWNCSATFVGEQLSSAEQEKGFPYLSVNWSHCLWFKTISSFEKKKKQTRRQRTNLLNVFFLENKLLHSPSMWQSRIKQRMAVWKWHYHMNVTFFLFSGNWIGKYSCWINTVSFWWDKAHSIAMKKNTGEVKEASYRCTEMKPKPDTVHMVNKLTLRLQPLWRGCPKPLLSSRNSVLYCWLILLIFFSSGIYESLLSGTTNPKTLKQFSTMGHRAIIHLGNNGGSYLAVQVSIFWRLKWIHQSAKELGLALHTVSAPATRAVEMAVTQLLHKEVSPMNTTLRGAWWINYHRQAQWAWLIGN